MKDFTKTQRIIKVGNSLAVTLSSKFVDVNDIQAGDPVIVSYTKTHMAVAMPGTPEFRLRDEGGQHYDARLTKTEKKAVVHSRVTPELDRWVNEFIKENKDSLEELANL